jgi:hypothetical protein
VKGYLLGGKAPDQGATKNEKGRYHSGIAECI